MMLDIPEPYRIADLKGRRPGQDPVAPPARIEGDLRAGFRPCAMIDVCGAMTFWAIDTLLAFALLTWG